MSSISTHTICSSFSDGNTAIDLDSTLHVVVVAYHHDCAFIVFRISLVENVPEPLFLSWSWSSSSESRSWSQCALICSNSRSTLASRRPRLSSGCEWTMLWRAAAARARAPLRPRVLPRTESLSLPCNNWISSGKHPINNDITHLINNTCCFAIHSQSRFQAEMFSTMKIIFFPFKKIKCSEFILQQYCSNYSIMESEVVRIPSED